MLLIIYGIFLIRIKRNKLLIFHKKLCNVLCIVCINFKNHINFIRHKTSFSLSRFSSNAKINKCKPPKSISLRIIRKFADHHDKSNQFLSKNNKKTPSHKTKCFASIYKRKSADTRLTKASSG